MPFLNPQPTISILVVDMVSMLPIKELVRVQISERVFRRTNGKVYRFGVIVDYIDKFVIVVRVF